MEETLHRADQRLAIRGNVSAVSLPWEQIYGKFADMTPEQQLATLPHALPALRSMIHLTVKGMLHAGARVRPWVVVALLDHLVDLAHPMFEGYDGTPAELKALFRAKVNQQYGKDEFPAVTQAEVDQAPTHHNPSPPQTKHATPEPAGVADFNGEAFQGNVRPQVLSPDGVLIKLQTLPLRKSLGWPLARRRSRSKPGTSSGIWGARLPEQRPVEAQHRRRNARPNRPLALTDPESGKFRSQFLGLGVGPSMLNFQVAFGVEHTPVAKTQTQSGIVGDHSGARMGASSKSSVPQTAEGNLSYSR